MGFGDQERSNDAFMFTRAPPQKAVRITHQTVRRRKSVTTRMVSTRQAYIHTCTNTQPIEVGVGWGLVWIGGGSNSHHEARRDRK